MAEPLQSSLWQRITVVGGETDVPISAYLGSYSIPEGRVDAAALLAKYNELGIPKKEQPRMPNPSDSFKVSVRTLEEKRDEKVDGWSEAKVSYAVRILNARTYALVREIVGRPHDAQGVPGKSDFLSDKNNSFRLDLDYEAAAGASTIDDEQAAVGVEWYNPEKPGDPAALDALRRRVRDEYVVVRRSIDGGRMRTIFGKVLRQHGAIPFTAQAGTWLVPKQHIDHIQRHAEAMKFYRLHAAGLGETAGGGIRFWPVIDTTEMRAWVIEDVQRDIMDRYNDLTNSVLSLLRSGKPENWSKMLELRKEVRKELADVEAKWSEALQAPIKAPTPLDTQAAKDAFIEEVDSRLAAVVAEMQDDTPDGGLPEDFDIEQARELILEVVGLKEPDVMPEDRVREVELGGDEDAG